MTTKGESGKEEDAAICSAQAAQCAFDLRLNQRPLMMAKPQAHNFTWKENLVTTLDET